jgi:hypothetical protein
MDVKWQAGDAPYGSDNGWADTDIGHKVTIHDIHVDVIRASGLGTSDRLGKVGEIGSEYGRRDFQTVIH